MVKLLGRYYPFILRFVDVFFWLLIGFIIGAIYGVDFTVDYLSRNGRL